MPASAKARGLTVPSYATQTVSGSCPGTNDVVSVCSRNSAAGLSIANCDKPNDERFNPARAIYGGAYHISDNLRNCGGNIEHALSNYWGAGCSATPYSAAVLNYYNDWKQCIRTTSPVTPLAIISCPVRDTPQVTCGSFGSNHPTCEHCNVAKGYPQSSFNAFCGFPSTKTGMDVAGTNAAGIARADDLDVYLPTIEGRTIDWIYGGLSSSSNGQYGWRKTFTATYGTDQYELHLSHLDNTNWPTGTKMQSGQVAGNMFDSLDAAGNGHVHIELVKNTQAVVNPETYVKC